MKSPQRKMQEKNPKPLPDYESSNDYVLISDIDSLSSGSNIITGYGNDSMMETFTFGPIGAVDTISIDTDTLTNKYITGSQNGISWADNTYSGILTNSHSSVNITKNGIAVDAEADIKVGDRSLKDFIDRVEERLAILHPNEILESKWEQLKDLRRQYEELEKDIIEKERIMKILKET